MDSVCRGSHGTVPHRWGVGWGGPGGPPSCGYSYDFNLILGFWFRSLFIFLRFRFGIQLGLLPSSAPFQWLIPPIFVSPRLGVLTVDSGFPSFHPCLPISCPGRCYSRGTRVIPSGDIVVHFRFPSVRGGVPESKSDASCLGPRVPVFASSYLGHPSFIS